MEDIKKCSKCGFPKPLEEFFRDKRTKDGRAGRCKECDKAMTYARRDADRERYNQSQKEVFARSQRRKRAAAEAARLIQENAKKLDAERLLAEIESELFGNEKNSAGQN